MLDKEYWLNRIKTDNAGDPVWITSNDYLDLKGDLIILEHDLNGMVLVKIRE